MAQEFPRATPQVQVPQDGSVQITSQTQITEREIHDIRETMVRRLDAAYLHIVDDMDEFQRQWTDGPIMALHASWLEGRQDGMKDWIGDQGELFKLETWKNMGEKAGQWAGAVYDRLAIYVPSRLDDFAQHYSVIADNPDGTILNWAWWKTLATNEANEVLQARERQLQERMQSIQQTIDGAEELTKRAVKIYQHREQIYRIPELISQGDGEAIMAFFRGPLMEIDPDLAKNILSNPNLPHIIALVQDRDSLLTYLAYVSLMFEAVPPNFYVYVAGKGGAYLALEVMLNIVLGLFTSGTFLVARVGMLLARFASMGAKAANANRKLKKVEVAIAAFRRYINECLEAINELGDLGKKLTSARARGLVLRGGTRQPINARKENAKNDLRCKCCGSTEHRSPRNAGNSVLVYR